ncbi:MAG: Ubiquinone/menaquinone biosynthesis C-methyltransferase UbiE [Calditrichaeota bacterium]|nr:Ubiquinone/menaquinone biosynthesis C-methyltransferase UbiE [Calditrichota bacterium]
MRRKPKQDALSARSRRVDVAPYTALAPYYDDVMSHVKYKHWAAYIAKLAARHEIDNGRAIDFACGTGALLLHLADHGYDTVGVDGSPRMIEQAKRRPTPPDRSMEWHVADLRETPPVEPCALGICVYDSVNYLTEEEQVVEFFRAARPVIAEGGLLVFDVSTEMNSILHFDGTVLDEQVEGAAYRRTTSYDPEHRIQHNVFNLYPDGEDVVYVEHHRQRIYAIDHVIELAMRGGFEPVAVYHEMTFRRGGENSDRVHIAAEPR